MLNKEFIPFEYSLEMKKLGFNEPCLGFYHIETKDLFPSGEMTNGFILNREKEFLKAPLWQQTFDWCLNILKKSHALHVCFYDGDNDCMIMEDFYLDSPKVLIDSTKEECLKKLIELCKKHLN